MLQATPDLLWKAILRSHFRQAMLFFKPTLHALIDWSFEPEFLDKELEALFPEAGKKSRRADHLVKIRLVTGDECFILVHIEVQGYKDEGFAERMFISNVRISERYGHQVFALAVLTDSNPAWHPTEFRKSFQGTEIIFRFNTYKVLDHPPETLLYPENPFSMVIETAYLFAKTYRLSDETKLKASLDLARRMFSRGYSKEDIRDFLRFLHQHFRFAKPENRRIFETEISHLVKSVPTMTLEEIMQKVMLTRGRKEGRKEGREEGIDSSIRKMLLNGMAVYMVSNILNVSLERVQLIESALRDAGDLAD